MPRKNSIQRQRTIKEVEQLTEWINQLRTLADEYNFRLEDVPDILTEYILIDNEILDLHEDNNTLKQRNNELAERLHQKEKECITIKNTIKDMMETERTHIGYNVLKQAYNAIME